MSTHGLEYDCCVSQRERCELPVGGNPPTHPVCTVQALYDVVILCDDSGSMLIDDRVEDLRLVVQKVAEVVSWGAASNKHSFVP